MLAQIDADGFEAAHVLLDHVGGRGLQDHLKLHVLVEAIGIVAVAAIGGAAAGLHVGGAVGLRAERAQEGFRARGAGADFHVERFLNDAAALAPVLLEPEDHLLERECWIGMGHAWSSGGFENRDGDEFSFDVGFDLLGEEAAEVGGGGLGPRTVGQLGDG